MKYRRMSEGFDPHIDVLKEVMKINGIDYPDRFGDAVVKREGGAYDELPLEHIDDSSCWCNPTLDYTDPQTEVSVWIHHNPS